MGDILKEIVLVGAGGIGSHTALALARTDLDKLTIYDPDAVERHNVDNQVYLPGDVRKAKVKALARYLRGLNYSQDRIILRRERVDESAVLRGIVIAAVDDLPARLVVCKAVFPGNPKCNYSPFLIMPGASQNVGMIYVFNPNDPDQRKSYTDIYFPEGKMNQDAPAACVDPELGPVFAGCITKVIKKLWGGWIPLQLLRIEIDFGDLTEIQTRYI